jgi:hypothetical protein
MSVKENLSFETHCKDQNLKCENIYVCFDTKVYVILINQMKSKKKISNHERTNLTLLVLHSLQPTH